MSDLATLEPATTDSPLLSQPDESKTALGNYIAHQESDEAKSLIGSRIPPERKSTIYTLRDVLGLSTAAIADRLSMGWETVDAILKTREADAVLSRNLLDASSLDAARAWVLACQTGAAKGRHEPARDLLLHRGVIEPIKQEAPNNSVTVVLNGGTAPPELRVVSPAKV